MMEKDWVIVIKLENGETTSATTENGCIKLFTREEAAAYIADFEIKKNPSIRLKFAFLPLKATEVKIAGVEAIPRAAYIQEKHDSFQFEEMRKRPKGILEETVRLMGSRGLMIDIDHPESALDAVGALLRLMERPVIQGTEINRKMIIQLLSEAHPIAWSRHMRRMAFDAIEQLREPLAVEQDTLMLNPMVFLFSDPQWHWVTAENGKFPFSPHGRKPFPDEVAIEAGEFDVAEIFSQDSEGVNCFRIAFTAGEDLKWATAAYMSSWPFGSVSKDVHDQKTLKCLRFAASPYLMLKRYQPQRAALRRAKDLELTVPKQGINVIILRRAQYIHTSYPRHDEGELVDWSYQWWVSGHWRRQWHPSTKTHKLTYIVPYIKGPPYKPLKEAVRLMVR